MANMKIWELPIGERTEGRAANGDRIKKYENMTPELWLEAVEWVRNILLSERGSEANRPLTEQEYLGMLEEGHGVIEFVKGQSEQLIEAARTDISKFNALRYAIANELEEDRPLNEEVKNWLIEYLKGKLAPPRAKRGTPESKGRKHSIVMVIDMLRTMGFNATRNDESKSSRHSACDVVAEAIEKIPRFKERATTYQAVKKIWVKRQHPKLMP